MDWLLKIASSNPPETVVWVLAPPSSSWVTSSLVTDLTTSGPVMNRYDVSCSQACTITVTLHSKYHLSYINRTSHHLAGQHLHHESEICEGRRVDGSSCTGAHDEGYLRDDSRSQHVPLEHTARVNELDRFDETNGTNVWLSKYQEYISISSQRLDAFLDPSSARVVQPDDWSSNRHGLVHNLCTEHLNAPNSTKKH